jgi:hypothetical protein
LSLFVSARRYNRLCPVSLDPAPCPSCPVQGIGLTPPRGIIIHSYSALLFPLVPFGLCVISRCTIFALPSAHPIAVRHSPWAWWPLIHPPMPGSSRAPIRAALPPSVQLLFRVLDTPASVRDSAPFVTYHAFRSSSGSGGTVGPGRFSPLGHPTEVGQRILSHLVCVPPSPKRAPSAWQWRATRPTINLSIQPGYTYR